MTLSLHDLLELLCIRQMSSQCSYLGTHGGAILAAPLWLILGVQCKLYLLSFWAQILFNLNVLDIGSYKMACDPTGASTFVSVLGL